MLNLTRAIDRATGYVFVPPADDDAPGTAGSARPNAHALCRARWARRAPGVRGGREGVQERWVDAREAWDALRAAVEARGRGATQRREGGWSRAGGFAGEGEERSVMFVLDWVPDCGTDGNDRAFWNQ